MSSCFNIFSALGRFLLDERKKSIEKKPIGIPYIFRLSRKQKKDIKTLYLKYGFDNERILRVLKNGSMGHKFRFLTIELINEVINEPLEPKDEVKEAIRRFKSGLKRCNEKDYWIKRAFIWILYNDFNKPSDDIAKALHWSTRSVNYVLRQHLDGKEIGLRGHRHRKSNTQVESIREAFRFLDKWREYYQWLGKPFQEHGFYASYRYEYPSYLKHQAPPPRLRLHLDVKIRQTRTQPYPWISRTTIAPKNIMASINRHILVDNG